MAKTGQKKSTKMLEIIEHVMIVCSYLEVRCSAGLGNHARSAKNVIYHARFDFSVMKSCP